MFGDDGRATVLETEMSGVASKAFVFRILAKPVEKIASLLFSSFCEKGFIKFKKNLHTFFEINL